MRTLIRLKLPAREESRSLLLFSFLIILFVAAACSRTTSDSHGSIVGGTLPDPVNPSLYSTVALVRKEGSTINTMCSGILVAPRLVLTAAHCVESNKTRLHVFFGMADTDVAAKTIAIQKSMTFKKDGSRFFPNFDIAWVKLVEDAPAPWKPIEILRSPQALDRIEGQSEKILLAGFGRTSSDCKNSECMGRLYEVWTNLEHFFNEAHFVNLLVIGPNPGHGSCNGDSGGPAFIKLNDRWVLAGILNGKSQLLNSLNLWEKGVCETGESIYNYVGAYVDWIESSSGIKLSYDAQINPVQKHVIKLDSANDLGQSPSLEQLLVYNNHNDDVWATVETLVSGFRNPLNRYGARMEELVTQPALAASAMRRWTEFRHIGVSFDFLIETQKSNQLVDVRPISELSGLKSLILDSNKIETTKSLGKLTQLEELSLRNNYDYSKKKRVPWDLSFIKSLHKLKSLDLSNNSSNLRLESIAWDNLKDLESLELSDNGRGLNLHAIPWASLRKLKKLTIRNSQLRDISALREAVSLETLDLSRNEIGSIAGLSELNNLDYLDLSMNSISDFSPLADLPVLKNLKALSNLQENNFCPTGAACVYSPVSFTDFESYCRFAFTLSPDDLSHWSGGATVMRLIQIAGAEALRVEGCHDAQSKLLKLRDLDLSGSPNVPPIEDLSPLSPLTQLEHLNLSNNDLRDIRPLASLQNLKTLDLSVNYVNSLTALSGLKTLETLVLDANLVTTLSPLASLTGLTVFAQDNPIEDDSCPIPLGSCYLDGYSNP